MQFQADFSSSAFGGFKKDDVIEYLANLERQYSEEQLAQQQQLDGLNAQLAQLQALVDQQYEKIVSSDALCREYKEALDALKQQLAPYEQAAKSAQELMDAAHRATEKIKKDAAAQAAKLHEEMERYAVEMRQNSGDIRRAAQEQAHRLVLEAQGKADTILDGVQDKADAMRQEAEDGLAEAKRQAEEIKENAREEARRIVGDARTESEQITKASRELSSAAEEEAARLRDEAVQMAEEAHRKAEEIVSAARQEAEQLKSRSAAGLHTLEEQKNILLRQFEEARSLLNVPLTALAPEETPAKA